MQFFENENFAARALGEICHFFGINLNKRLAFQKSQKVLNHSTLLCGEDPDRDSNLGRAIYIMYSYIHIYLPR